MKQLKYFSTFSGIGGFELGIQQAYEELYNIRPNELVYSQGPTELHNTANKLQQWKCVGYSEIDKYAIQVYNKHFKHKNYGDITKIKAEELPDFDLLVGGFPCQSFSIAGKRKGFEDTRGTLFFDLTRILQAKKPSYFIFENVKGLLNHDKGNTFVTIITTITELGYDCQWQVLNSKNFGVPQNRERVFIIGHLRGKPRPKVFPIGEDAREIIGKHKERKIEIIGTTNTMQGGNRQPFIKAVLTPNRLKKRQNGRRIKEHGEPSFTLTGQDQHGVQIGPKIRRLTPKECERLQGFPDGWTENISDTQRYKCLGNAVSVPVIKAIVKRLIV